MKSIPPHLIKLTVRLQARTEYNIQYDIQGLTEVGGMMMNLMWIGSNRDWGWDIRFGFYTIERLSPFMGAQIHKSLRLYREALRDWRGHAGSPFLGRIVEKGKPI